MRFPSVSVVVPSLGCDDFLLSTISSCLAQEKVVVTIVVVSPCKGCNLEVPDPRVSYVYQEREGIYPALNLGIKSASGYWLTFLGSGDELDKHDVLSRMLQRGENCRAAGVIYGAAVLVDTQAKCDVFRAAQFPRLVSNWKMPFAHGAGLYAKYLFRDFGDFDKRYAVAADFDWIVRVLSQSVKTTRVNFPVVRHVMGGISTGSATRVQAIREESRVLASSHPKGCLTRRIFRRLKISLNEVRILYHGRMRQG